MFTFKFTLLTFLSLLSANIGSLRNSASINHQISNATLSRFFVSICNIVVAHLINIITYAIIKAIDQIVGGYSRIILQNITYFNQVITNRFCNFLGIPQAVVPARPTLSLLQRVSSFFSSTIRAVISSRAVRFFCNLAYKLTFLAVIVVIIWALLIIDDKLVMVYRSFNDLYHQLSLTLTHARNSLSRLQQDTLRYTQDLSAAISKLQVKRCSR